MNRPSADQSVAVLSWADSTSSCSLPAPLDRAAPFLRPGRSYRIDVVARTRGIGHFFPGGTVDAFDQNFKQVDSFTDKQLPKGYAPFNVQVLDGHLFVTFALQDADKHDDVAGAGHGFVDEFDLEGHLLDRVASRGPLDSPWGLAIAPSGFGEFAGDLLVGNFGDGTINAFDLKDDHFEGKLLDVKGAPITIGDLWALIPGNGSANSDPNKIYFTAGVENEGHGLFGSLAAIPEPDRSAMSMPGSHPHG